MSSTLNIDEIRKLTIEQKLALVDEIVSTIDVEALPFSPEQWKEIEHRLNAYEANPESAISYEEYKARMRAMM